MLRVVDEVDEDLQDLARHAANKRLNPATWRLAAADAGQAQEIKDRAKHVSGGERRYSASDPYGSRDKDLSFETSAERKDFDKRFAVRDKAAEQARTHQEKPDGTWDPADREIWGKSMAQMREQSRLIGESAARAAVEKEIPKRFGPGAKGHVIYPVGSGSRSGDFDLLYGITRATLEQGISQALLQVLADHPVIGGIDLRQALGITGG